jgi:hypothetical protein
MFRTSTAHHQEVRCMYVANDTSKITVSESEFADTNLRSNICHIHTPYLLMLGW